MRSNRLRQPILAATFALACSGCFSSGDEKPEPKNLVKDPTLGELELLQNAKAAYDQGLYSVSQKSWAELRDGYPASYYAPLAELKAADSFFFAADFASAIVAYQEFLRLHPGHEAVAYVRYQIARANFEQYRGVAHDQSPLLAAIKAYAELIEKNGDSEYAVRARRELDRCKELHAEHIALVARFYDKMGLVEASENRLAVLEGEFPSSRAARELELEGQSGRPLPPHATKEQPQPPLVISRQDGGSGAQVNSLPAKAGIDEGPATTPDVVPSADLADSSLKAADSNRAQGAAVTIEEGHPRSADDKDSTSSEQSRTAKEGSFLSSLTCASASGRVVITARTKAVLGPVKIAKEQGTNMTLNVVEASPASGPARAEKISATCSAGPVNAVATEQRLGDRWSIKLALSSLEPMRFYVLNQGQPLQIAAVPLNE